MAFLPAHFRNRESQESAFTAAEDIGWFTGVDLGGSLLWVKVVHVGDGKGSIGGGSLDDRSDSSMDGA